MRWIIATEVDINICERGNVNENLYLCQKYVYGCYKKDIGTGVILNRDVIAIKEYISG